MKTIAARVATALSVTVLAMTAADAQRTATPGGVLPLKPGVYVGGGADCGDPPNAAIRLYDRTGLSGSATHACRARVLSRRGSVYRVSQSCIDTPAGRGPRTSEQQTITIQDALTFTLRTNRDSMAYRYCPPRQLPGWLLKRAPG